MPSIVCRQLQEPLAGQDAGEPHPNAGVGQASYGLTVVVVVETDLEVTVVPGVTVVRGVTTL
jgi:hypothetical protein